MGNLPQQLGNPMFISFKARVAVNGAENNPIAVMRLGSDAEQFAGLMRNFDVEEIFYHS